MLRMGGGISSIYRNLYFCGHCWNVVSLLCEKLGTDARSVRQRNYLTDCPAGQAASGFVALAFRRACVSIQSARLKAGSTIAPEIQAAAQTLPFGRKRDQRVEFLPRGAGIHGFGCEARAFKKIRGAPGGDDCSSSVGYDDVAARAWFAGQDGAEEFRVVCGVAAEHRGNWRAAEAEIFGRDFVDADVATSHVAHFCFAGQRNLVEAACTVNDECALDAEFGERSRHFFHHACGEDTGDLRTRARRIR